MCLEAHFCGGRGYLGSTRLTLVVSLPGTWPPRAESPPLPSAGTNPTPWAATAPHQCHPGWPLGFLQVYNSCLSPCLLTGLPCFVNNDCWGEVICCPGEIATRPWCGVTYLSHQGPSPALLAQPQTSAVAARGHIACYLAPTGSGEEHWDAGEWSDLHRCSQVAVCLTTKGSPPS